MRSPRRHSADRHALRFLSALFACVVALSLVAPTALAGGPNVARPPAPDKDSGTPHFVTQTDVWGKWTDCEWASAAMLVEKWTGERVTHQALRIAANAPKGASSLDDIARGTANLLGLHLRYSPDGGDPMTWGMLLTRLARGGGAVLEGAYSRMPRWFQRLDRKFAASGPEKSGHAVYVERYEPRRGRVWLMDPLGQGDYRGEWISVWDLRRFASFRGGLVRAAATPAPLPPMSLKKVHFGQPRLTGTLAVGTLGVLVVPMAHRGRRPPTLVPLRISTTWVKVDPALPDGPTAAPATVHAPALAAGVPGAPGSLVGATSTPAADPMGTTAPATWVASSSASLVTSGRMGMVLRPTGWDLVAKVNLPTEPGRYRLTMALRNARGRAISPKNVPAFKPMIVSIAGPYRVGFDAPEALELGDHAVTFGVTNTGRAAWVLTAGRVGGPLATSPHLVADWTFPDRSTTPAGTVFVELEPGASATVALPLSAMPVGATGLRLDLVGPDGRPISEHGGRPTVIPILTTGATQKPT